MNPIQELCQLDCSTITAGDNDRHDFEPIALANLAQSIAQHGLAQPITVRPIPPTPEGKIYEIIAGERRFRAISTILKWETIPAIIKTADDEEASDIMLMENTARANLNPIEEAQAYGKRLDKALSQGKKREDIIARISEVAGVKVSHIEKRLLLLLLDETIQEVVAQGTFKVEWGEVCATLDHPKQLAAFRIYKQAINGLTLPAFRKVVKELAGEQTQEGLFALESFWVTQVQAEPVIKRGKLAKTHAPTRADLPAIAVTATDNVGSILDRAIATYLQAGLTQDAATLGTLYDLLVKTNFVSIPDAPMLR